METIKTIDKRYCVWCGTGTPQKYIKNSIGEFFVCKICEKKEIIHRVSEATKTVSLPTIKDVLNANNLENLLIEEDIFG